MAIALVTLVAILHLWFLILECFLWDKPLGRKTFRMDEAKAKATKALAINQGLYNGFLSAGLILGAFTHDLKMTVFFLVCVIIAGVVGALTANKKIFFIQSLPAILALIMVLL
jgi:putative membrane protein